MRARANNEALLGCDLTPVEKAVLASARRVATEGTGEGTILFVE